MDGCWIGKRSLIVTSQMQLRYSSLRSQRDLRADSVTCSLEACCTSAWVSRSINRRAEHLVSFGRSTGGWGGKSGFSLGSVSVEHCRGTTTWTEKWDHLFFHPRNCDLMPDVEPLMWSLLSASVFGLVIIHSGCCFKIPLFNFNAWVLSLCKSWCFEPDDWGAGGRTKS